MPGVAKIELLPESPTKFFYIDFNNEVTFTFLAKDGGEIGGFAADMNGLKFSANKVK